MPTHEVSNTFKSLLIALALASLLALTACDAPGALSDTPATPVATTAANGSGQGGPAPQSAGGALPVSLAAAIERTRAMKTYRIAFDFEMGSETNGQKQTQPFIVFDGDVKGDANHLTYHGGEFTDMLGGGTAVEMISIGGRTYLKGSTFFGSAEPNRWYYLPDNITQPPFSVDDILRLTGGDLSPARQTGTLTVDGLACGRWQADFAGHATGLVDLTNPADNKTDFNQIDTASAQFSACADGLVHEMQWNVVSHNATNPADKASIAVTVHLRDFNAPSIVIAAPQGASELK